jgi:hypothetical protein
VGILASAGCPDGETAFYNPIPDPKMPPKTALSLPFCAAEILETFLIF